MHCDPVFFVWFGLVFAFSQLGAESADSIGAVLNSKDEQREIAETRETCRSKNLFCFCFFPFYWHVSILKGWLF